MKLNIGFGVIFYDSARNQVQLLVVLRDENLKGGKNPGAGASASNNTNNRIGIWAVHRNCEPGLLPSGFILLDLADHGGSRRYGSAKEPNSVGICRHARNRLPGNPRALGLLPRIDGKSEKSTNQQARR